MGKILDLCDPRLIPHAICHIRYLITFNSPCPNNTIYFQVIESLDDPQKYEAHLQTLGAKHVMYEADISMIEALAQAMVDNVHQILKRQVF